MLDRTLLSVRSLLLRKYVEFIQQVSLARFCSHLLLTLSPLPLLLL